MPDGSGPGGAGLEIHRIGLHRQSLTFKQHLSTTHVEGTGDQENCWLILGKQTTDRFRFLSCVRHTIRQPDRCHRHTQVHSLGPIELTLRRQARMKWVLPTGEEQA